MATHEADRSRLDRAADYLAKSRHALQLDTPRMLYEAVDALVFAVGELISEVQSMREERPAIRAQRGEPSRSPIDRLADVAAGIGDSVADGLAESIKRGLRRRTGGT